MRDLRSRFAPLQAPFPLAAGVLARIPLSPWDLPHCVRHIPFRSPRGPCKALLSRSYSARRLLFRFRQTPSKHYPEERNLRFWWKYNKKLYNAGRFDPDRLPLFQHLLDLDAACQRKREEEAVAISRSES